VSASLPALRSQRLDLRQSTVYGHFGAGHERSIRRRQERNRSGNLRRLADSLHRHFGTTSRTNWSICSFGNPVRANPSGVSIGPGLTAFTRIPRSANSAASERVNERRADFVAAYTEPFTKPISLAPTY